MDRILVISNDPSLAETLESELAPLTVTHASPSDAPALLREEQLRLIVADDETGELGALLSGANAPVLWLKRPARLGDLLYTIGERLQGKSAPDRQIALAEGWLLLPGDRALCAPESGERIALTEKEAELLLCLLEAPGKAVLRDAILKRVWGYSDAITTHTLETHIYRLRGKLAQMNKSVDIAFSEEGGYRLSIA